jgi:tripartite-type tricarboxylate transporter receptor subunit TctC
MKNPSRRLLLSGAAAALTAPAIARADTWPSRPIRCIVALPPGGGTDATGRLAMQ